MDYLKEETAKDFTAWDLNCPQVYKPHNRKRNKQVLKRKARRKLKKKISKDY